MAVHGPIPWSPPNRSKAPTLTPLHLSLARSHGADGHHPTIRREDEFDEDRLSGEYYSGEEFYEDDSMLSGDRYYFSGSSRCALLTLRANQQSSLLWFFLGIRPVTQSMRLPKDIITQTLTTMMMNSLSTTTHGGHQRDGCFLQRLKVS